MHRAQPSTCCLKVELPEGTYLADVGFGNLAPTCALLLVPQIEQEAPHEVMRFIDVGGELTLQARLKHGWQHIYRVIPYPRYDGEYEITNWYTATHPDTPYQGNIIVAKPGPNRSRIMSSLPTRRISCLKYGVHFFNVEAESILALVNSDHNASNFLAEFGASNFGYRAASGSGA
jgi:arylamine N-acetyltransferase